jgi:hypothetical protein
MLPPDVAMPQIVAKREQDTNSVEPTGLHVTKFVTVEGRSSETLRPQEDARRRSAAVEGVMPSVVSASRGRRVTFGVLAGVLGLLLGIAAFSLPALVLGWFIEERVIHRVHDLGWGALGGIILTLGLLVQLRAPERKIAAMQQVALGVVALVVASVIAGEGTLFVLVPIIALLALVALHPARHEFLRPGTGFSPALGAIALLAAVPLTLFALDQAALQRAGVAADAHSEEAHWMTMAALGFALALVALLAASKTRGWRIPAWSAGGVAIVFGLASAIFPDYASSVGVVWGAVAVVGGVAFIGIAEVEARQGRSPERSVRA